MMKRIIVSLFISIYMLSSIAADTSYVGNFPADGQAAEAVLEWSPVVMSTCSLWFTDSAGSGLPEYPNYPSVELTDEAGRASGHVYLNYIIYTNGTAKISVRAKDYMKTASGEGHVDWGIYGGTSGAEPITVSNGEYDYQSDHEVLSSNDIQFSGSKILYIMTEPIDQMGLVDGTQTYTSELEVKVETTD